MKNLLRLTRKNFAIKISDFSKFKPHSEGYKLQNFYNGKWQDSKHHEELPHPLKGNNYCKVPITQGEELTHVVNEMNQVPRSGLHNPLKNPERYVKYGEISRKLAEALHNPEIFNHFVELIRTCVPKSLIQSQGEMRVTRDFLANFSADNVRFLAKGFHVPGDYTGQQSNGYRWPYGPVSLVCPFNYPIEIPVLQLLGALFMGNKPLVKGDSRVSICLEEFVSLMHACGMPKEDLVLIHTDGKNMEQLYKQINFRMTMFTGSSRTAERLCELTRGRIRIEDAGLDWKVLGPDVQEIEYVAHLIDHDSYAFAGQKCSAESLLFMHENWSKTDLLSRVQKLAERRSLKDMTNVPLLTWSNKKISDLIDRVLKIPGTKILFGGKPIEEKHSIPECYGSFQPTAIFAPLEAFKNKEYYETLTTEMFGPYQIVTQYNDSTLEDVLQILENLDQQLTCGVVSNDMRFQQKVLSRTLNGTTYTGIKARTTGAPQNHWFGPSGDPRGGGIGTFEAIRLVWSCHREIIQDYGEVDKSKLIQS